MYIIHTLHVYTKQTGFFYHDHGNPPPFPLQAEWMTTYLMNQCVTGSGAINCALSSFEFCV